MKFVNLPGELVTGFDTIDVDHDQLYSIVNMFEATKNNKDTNFLCSVFQFLLDYTSYHFKKEEIGFSLSAYPDGIEHEIEHRNLEDAVKSYEKLIRETPDEVDDAKLQEIGTFLRDWLFHHIKVVDMGYVATFKAAPETVVAMEQFSFAPQLNQEDGPFEKTD